MQEKKNPTKNEKKIWEREFFFLGYGNHMYRIEESDKFIVREWK